MGWSIVDSHLRRWADTMATVWRRERADPNVTKAARMVLATVERQWTSAALRGSPRCLFAAQIAGTYGSERLRIGRLRAIATAHS